MTLPLPETEAPRVLIVDDDPLVLQALETTLESANHPVFATEDPLAGFAYLKEHRISVIIADQRMDAMSGLELLDHARELQPNASRILITGLLSVKMLMEAVNGGEIYRFIAKPWTTSELLATIHNAVQRYHLLEENTALQERTRILNEQLLSEKRALQARVEQLATQNAEMERHFAMLGTNRSGLFQFCDSVLQAFDSRLATQTRQTVELCHQVATAAGLSSELREGLVAAAWLHDLGLIALSRRSDASQPWDSSAAGFLDHPAVSERLALAAGLGEAVAQGVRGHHESFDGGGFPDRVRGHHIPEIARWLTPVAYFVESGLSKQDAIEEIEKLSGVAFDPNVVRTFLKIAIGLPSRASVGGGTRQASGLSSTIRCA